MVPVSAEPQFLTDNLLGFAPYASTVGLDPVRLLSRVGLGRDALSKPGEPIAFSACAELLQLAATESGDPMFGFRFATHQSIQFVAALAPVALAAPTILTGLQRMTEAHIRYSSATRWELVRQGDSWLLHMKRRDPRLPRPPQLTMHAVTMTLRLLRAIFGDLPARAALFDHARPGNVQTMRRFFGMPLRFDQPAAGLLLDAQDLQRPPQLSELRLAAVLGAASNRPTAIGELQESTVSQLRSQMDRMLGVRPVTLHTMSRSLRLSPRALRRRLSAEDMRFSTVLAEVRTARACHYLANSSASLTEIASRLGYGDLSAFSRAFRRDTGMCPNRWRRAHRGGQ